ncbi:MAG TPA: LacI family DNA-binding transcriptional regulator [Actinomycetota bacterium]|nr:LacI family DNA-binding transcriptional regulator [Actinomycetota bacterium]
MPDRRVSIKDVAREAGVSVTTVSHALNDKGRLSETTRSHVRAVADRLGYRPNPAARSLVSGKTGLIAAMPSLPDDPRIAFSEFGYYSALIGAASGAAVARDRALVVAPPSRSGFIWDRVPLDGVLVIDPLVGEPALPALRAAGIPYVTIGHDADDGAGPSVTAEERAATHAMLDHLAAGARAEVGLLTIPPINAFIVETIAAYDAWCAARATPPRRTVMDLDRLVADDLDYLRDEIGRLLAQGVDAIYAPIEIVGVEVARTLRSMGHSIPDDVMVATTDDAGRAAASDPPMTTLSYDYAEMGRRAATLLLALVDGEEPAERQVTVPARVTPRASTQRR